VEGSEAVGVARKQSAADEAGPQKGDTKPNAADDRGVLKKAEAKLRTGFDASFSDSDVKHIECRAWQEYRERNPNGKLDLDRFAAYAAANYGGLRIRSKPEGAAIVVDNTSWEGPTDAQNMCSVGTRHIILSKPGYYDEAGDAVVKQGAWTVFEKDLRPKP
jgi:hypothetical protein